MGKWEGMLSEGIRSSKFTLAQDVFRREVTAYGWQLTSLLFVGAGTFGRTMHISL